MASLCTSSGLLETTTKPCVLFKQRGQHANSSCGISTMFLLTRNHLWKRDQMTISWCGVVLLSYNFTADSPVSALGHIPVLQERDSTTGELKRTIHVRPSKENGTEVPIAPPLTYGRRLYLSHDEHVSACQPTRALFWVSKDASVNLYHQNHEHVETSPW